MTMLAMFLAFLFVVAGLASFAGWVWLVVRGFKTSVGWGLLMFFFAPIVAIVVAVREWSEWKRPFLLYYGGAGVQVVLIVVVLVALPFALPWGAMKQQAQLMEQSELAASMPRGFAQQEAASGATDTQETEPAAETAQLEPPTDAPRPRLPMEEIPSPDDVKADETETTDPTGQPASASMSEHVPGSQSVAPLVAPSLDVPPGFEEVAFAAAKGKVGSKVRVVTADGRVHPGTLIGAEGSSIRVTFEVGGGSVAMDYAAAEVRSLQVAR
jgi:hypothetical protein